jgi:ATP-dependent Clp protease ATP-binding subunit ClpC
MAKKNFSDEQWEKFTDELKDVLKFIEDTLTYEHPVLAINENYFLLAIFQEQNCLAYKIIDALLSSTAIKLIHDAYFRIVTKGQLTAIKPNRVIPFDEKFYELINEGNEEMKRMGDEKLSSIHVVLALINPEREHQNVQKIMKSAGLNYNLLINRLASLKDIPAPSEEIEDEETTETAIEPKKKTPKSSIQDLEFELHGVNVKPITGQFLTTYCHNLNKRAKDGKIDPVIGREKEIDRITKIFNRRRKNNVVIVGDKGSGKTAICESLAWLITNNQAPYSLRDKTILKLDVSSMIAGTTYRGMFEERAKGVFNELQKNPKCILFVDDFHTQTARPDSESSTDITPYLKEVISDGSVKVMVTCTPKGYHKKFDGDQSLANKFQRIDLTQLQEDEIKHILMNVKETYEKYHSVQISEDIIDLCISLCKKYVTDREMPDSVIDLIDEVGACVSKKYEESDEVRELKTELLALAMSKKDAIKNENFDEVDSIVEKETKKSKLLKEKEKKQKCDIVEITDKMIFETISEKTGIPIQNLSDENKKDLATINERLKRVIIGQDDAIDKVCRTIKRKRLGLHNGRGTAMFFQGKTGCGKTLLAKKLAEELFGSETAMVRFDMSEYSDKTGVNKLIGSNPGYVGYEEGGLLTEAIKNKKHCILLLDEIEKADNEIFNIFLQVFDEGFLTDNTGQKVDFRNVIILLTSNVGAREASTNNRTIGFGQSKSDEDLKTKNILDKELKRRFAPEFLNRLDGIIYFNPLDEKSLKQIVKLEIDKSVKRFKDIGYNITYNDGAIDHVFQIIKDESEYGARPIIRAVQNEIEDPLTDAILDGECSKDISIEFNDKEIVIDCGKTENSSI